MIASIGTRIVIAATLSLLAFLPASPALAQTHPLDADKAFALSVTRIAPDTLRFAWSIAPGYYLYRDKIRVAVPGQDAALSVVTAQGMQKDDPTFGQTEVYLHKAEATLGGQQAEARQGGRLTITYQGCQENGICYPPATRILDLATLAFTDDGAKQSAQSRFGEWDAAISAPALPTSGITVASNDENGMVKSLLKDGGIAFVLASFLLFGVALAFTPCVFPMYPILAGALSRAGNSLSPLRGFALSSVYVLAMASAFGLLGIAAAWSGQNLQIALQSPIAIIAVSVLFAALALSMFGLFDLRLPSRWVNSIAPAGQPRSGSIPTTALLGFTSALIVGPCVTAPLAGALLYIAQTGDVFLGAMALFALGIGKGIPLIAFGTIGPKALPKAGGWMEGVKTIFGLVFLATAIWMLSRIIPGEYALALWALLLIGSAVSLGAFDMLDANATSLRRAAKAAGLAASLYGAILAVGAAAGSADPLRPLAPFVQAVSDTRATTRPTFTVASDPTELSARIADARGRPSLVYFTADWCLTCAVIDRNVLPDANVRARLADFNLVKIDVSSNSPAQQQMMRELGVAGPPTMLLVDQSAREIPNSRLVGNVTTETLLASTALAQRHP